MAERPRLKTPFDTPPPERPAEPAEAAPAEPGRPPRRFSFGLKAFFAATFVLAFAAGGYGGMTQHNDNFVFYVIFSLMTPFVVLAIAGVAHTLARRFRKKPADTRGPFDS